MSAAKGIIETAIEEAVARAVGPALEKIEAALRSLKPEGHDDLLTIDKAAEITGWKIRTLRLKAKAGKIPAVKLPNSREWRFRRSDLLALGQPATLDIDREARKILANLSSRGR